MSNVYCPHCTVVSTSLGPRVQLCEQHAERDRLAAENEHVKEWKAHGLTGTDAELQMQCVEPESWALAVPLICYVRPAPRFLTREEVGVVVAVVREEHSGRCALAVEWCENTVSSKRAAISRVADFLAQKGIPHHQEATA